MSIFTNRRKMLMGLASAATAAATGVTASGSVAPQDDAGLIELADGLDGTLQAHQDACATVTSIVEQWGPKWPVPDPEIVRYGNACERHADIQGYGVQTEWGKSGLMRVQSLGTPEYFTSSAASHRLEYERKAATKSGRGAKLHQRWAESDTANIAPSKAYWSEVERITKASGIKAAQQRVRVTRDELRDLVGAILTYRERTIAGLVIKAEAMQAWGNVETFHVALNLEAPKWSEEVAATIVRQAGAA